MPRAVASSVPLDPARRLNRLRKLAWLLDRSIPVGNKGRFGLDPLLGLIPGLGDWAGAGLSLYIVHEAMQLGLSWPVLARMLANIGFEALVGTIPVAGDLFDFFWQANVRNLQLVERHYRPGAPPRSTRGIVVLLVAFGLFLLALLVAAAALTAWVFTEVWRWLAGAA